MSREDREKWDRRYGNAADTPAEAAFVLREFAHLLPHRGEALDLAAGRGANALLLAQHGLHCSAWDLSAIAMEQLAARAVENGLRVTCETRDVVAQPPAPDSFDVIVVSRFLHRPLCPAISAALRPGGLLYYQTFTREKTDSTLGPSNPDYLLGHNELLRLFPGLSLLAYREEGSVGDTTRGLRNEACLVAIRD